MQFHMMALLDVLGKIAWVKEDFLSHGKISDILIRCARILFIYCSKYDKGQDLSCMPFILRMVKDCMC